MQNVYGERFDLMRAGRHVLVHLPKNTHAEGTLLRIEAEARRLGKQCADIYFQVLNVTGKWAASEQSDGLHFNAADSVTEEPRWLKLGSVELKVVHGHTLQGLQYLNLYLKHLAHTGFTVGGLLGEDEHTQQSTPSSECVHHTSMFEYSPP